MQLALRSARISTVGLMMQQLTLFIIMNSETVWRLHTARIANF